MEAWDEIDTVEPPVTTDDDGRAELLAGVRPGTVTLVGPWKPTEQERQNEQDQLWNEAPTSRDLPEEDWGKYG